MAWVHSLVGELRSHKLHGKIGFKKKIMYVKHMKILDTEQVLSKWIQTLKAILGFPSGSAIKNQPANAGDVGSILALG